VTVDARYTASNATEARSRRRATPGPPDGKIEKSLNTLQSNGLQAGDETPVRVGKLYLFRGIESLPMYDIHDS
jgi:hypothetical protein